MNDENKLPYSVIRQAANELLVTIVLMALHKAASMLAQDCDITQAEANAILCEKLVQFLTKHPSSMINPDVGAVYFNIEIVDSETVNYAPLDNGVSDIGSMSWLQDDSDDSDNENGLTVAA